MPKSRTIPWSGVDGVVRETWSQLAQRGRLNPTLKPEWVEIVAHALRGHDREPAVFIEEEGGAVSAVVPYYIASVRMAGVPMKAVQPASNLISYHAELVTSAPPREVLMRMLASVRGWDVLHFANVDMSSPTAAAVSSLAAQLRTPLQVIPSDVSPYLPIEGRWADFLATKNKKFRYKLRHRRELLDKNGAWDLRWYEGAVDVEPLLAAILHIEKFSWKAREGVDIPSKPHELEYHRQLLPFLARSGALLANVLSIEGQPAAYCLCCRAGDWVGNLKTSFDERFATLSPGAVVIDESVARAFDLGAREFDFLGNAGSHKVAWTAHSRAHADYFLFAPRLKGRLIGWLKTRRKAAFAAQPAATAADSE